MKKTWIIVYLCLLSTVCFGQESGVLKFLGIPMEGPKEQFEEQLTDKGFKRSDNPDVFKGKYNKKQVEVAVRTKDEVVNQVCVSFQDTTVQKVIEEYNQLINLFRKDKDFVDFTFNVEMMDDEDIPRKMAKGKRYEAHFNYYDPDFGPKMMDALLNKLGGFFTEDQLVRMKELAQKINNTPQDQKDDAFLADVVGTIKKIGIGDPNEEPDPGKAFQFMGAFIEAWMSLTDGDVWFKIQEFDNPARIQNRYRIVLYYDANK